MSTEINDLFLLADVFIIIYNRDFGEKCTTMDNILVAHYDLEKEHIERMYEASGHNLMVFEDYAQIAIGEFLSVLSFYFFEFLCIYSEIIASFLIMRHIKLYKL